jgi:hypothetical protein
VNLNSNILRSKEGFQEDFEVLRGVCRAHYRLILSTHLEDIINSSLFIDVQLCFADLRVVLVKDKCCFVVHVDSNLVVSDNRDIQPNLISLDLNLSFIDTISGHIIYVLLEFLDQVSGN